MTDATEQLLALELAREARRRRRNRVLVWLAAIAALVAVVYLTGVKPAMDQAAADERREQSLFCGMVYDYGSDDYNACLDD